MQLELRYWPPGCVRQVLDDYLTMKCRTLSDGGLRDYEGRRAWLLEVFGPMTWADDVTFDVLERVAREARGVLKDVTIKARFKLWRAAATLAMKRGRVKAVAEMPPDLIDDSVKGGRFYTLAQYQEFRLALPPGRYRVLCDLSQWTGMHTIDLIQTERRHLDPDYAWPGSDWRGAWLRRNTKNANPKKPIKIPPCLVPMEPEFRELAIEWLAKPAPPDQRIVGHLNNVNRTFEAAAARCGLHRIRPNIDFRAGLATLLLLRGWSYEFVRIVLGHVGEVSGQTIDGHLRAVTAKRPTTLSGHYARAYAHPDHLRG